jgi:hypothetical protein
LHLQDGQGERLDGRGGFEGKSHRRTWLASR